MIDGSKRILILGGSGFIGRNLVSELVLKPYVLNIVSRSHRNLAVGSAPGQITLTQLDLLQEPKKVDELVDKADIIINFAGTITSLSKKTYRSTHVLLPEMLGKAASRYDVDAIIHISALGIDKVDSIYAKSKLEGEKALLKHFEKAVIIRPSVVYGHDDHFISNLARSIRLTPIIPLIGGGKTKVQPIFVGDLVSALDKLVTDSHEYEGKILDIAGPSEYTINELMSMIADILGIKKRSFTVPTSVAKVVATLFTMLGSKILSPEQINLLSTDNTTNRNALKTLGVRPTSLDAKIYEILEGFSY